MKLESKSLLQKYSAGRGTGVTVNSHSQLKREKNVRQKAVTILSKSWANSMKFQSSGVPHVAHASALDPCLPSGVVTPPLRSPFFMKNGMYWPLSRFLSACFLPVEFWETDSTFHFVHFLLVQLDTVSNGIIFAKILWGTEIPSIRKEATP